MEKHIFNLKLAVKDLSRNAKKCEKAENLEKSKTKRYLQNGNIALAKIHAENAIRQRNQSINYLQLGARIDGALSRINSVQTTKKIIKSMHGVLQAIDATFKNMNLEEISTVMDKFERQFENLDVNTMLTQNTMAQTITTTISQADVENLIKQIADENNLELNVQLPSRIPSDNLINLDASIQAEHANENDQLTKRLSKLRQN